MKRNFLSSTFYLLTVAFVFTLGSCTPYKATFNSSQKLFNQAGEVSTAWITDPNRTGEDPGQALYKEAHDKVSKMTTDFKDKLIADQIYGNALALKALCELNLSKYDIAQTTATEANTYIDRSAHPDKQRDKAFMKALPGLIKTNQLVDMLADITGQVTADQYTDLENLATGAMADIETGKKTVAATHPANGYLISNQLVVVKTWIDGINRTLKNATDEEMKIAEEREKKVFTLAKGLVTSLSQVKEVSPNTIEQWKKIIGMGN